LDKDPNLNKGKQERELGGSLNEAEKKFREKKFQEICDKKNKSDDTGKRGFASKSKVDDSSIKGLKEGKSGNYPKQEENNADLTKKEDLGSTLTKEEVDQRMKSFD